MVTPAERQKLTQISQAVPASWPTPHGAHPSAPVLAPATEPLAQSVQPSAALAAPPALYWPAVHEIQPVLSPFTDVPSPQATHFSGEC